MGWVRISNFFTVARQLKSIKPSVINFVVPQRGTASADSIVKLNRPKSKKFWDPSFSHDLKPVELPDKEQPMLFFQNSDELKTADVNVKKIFSIEFQPPKWTLEVVEKMLVDKVKRHPVDNSSIEVYIAKLTGKIRFHQPILKENPLDKLLKKRVKEWIEARTRALKVLRIMDYKRFEWLLEKLDLMYKPCAPQRITRKESLTLIAKLNVLKMKEEKLGKLKKSLDEQKVPFLEKKLENLKLIQEMEKNNNLTPTVTDKDIEECIEKIKTVTFEVAERQKLGYVKKVHPYTLELYDEALLKEKENQFHQ